MKIAQCSSGQGPWRSPAKLFLAGLFAWTIFVGSMGHARGADTAGVSNRTVKVAAVQFISEFGKPDVNRRGLAALIRKAAAAGAKIVVLPETAITGYASADLKTVWRTGNLPLSEGLQGVSPQDAAETVPGASTAAFGKLARELGLYLTIPLLEVDPKTSRFFNTVVLVSPQGERLLHYRKLNPWPWAERAWATKGDHGLQYVDTPYGRLGLLICYDINFEPPHLKAAGVDILLYSIAWVDEPKSPWFKGKLPEIARDNALHIVGANWSVRAKQPWSGYGHSLVIDRTGKTLAKVSSDLGDEIVCADVPYR